MNRTLNVSKLLLLAYFLFSGITWIQDSESLREGMLGRVALPDFLMCGLVMCVFVTIRRIYVPTLAQTALLLVGAFLVSTCLAGVLTWAAVEILIHLFLVVGFVAMFNIVRSMSVDERIDLMVWWVRMGALLGGIGLWDFIAPILGLPSLAGTLASVTGFRIMQADVVGAVTGTFRNTGQAGAFFQVVLCCGIALQSALKGARRHEVFVLTILTLICVILTVKRASIIGLGVGLSLLAFREGVNGFVKTTLLVGVAGLILTPVVEWLSESSTAFAWRVDKKVTRGIGDDSFLAANVEVARESFLDNPFTGAGVLGSRVMDRYELHSTYLKMIGDGGLLGVACYGWFVVILFRSCLRPRNSDPRVKKFARFFAPLLIGLMVSWAYTYHLRKREFWITAALVSGLMAPAVVRGAAGPPPLARRRLRRRALPAGQRLSPTVVRAGKEDADRATTADQDRVSRPARLPEPETTRCRC